MASRDWNLDELYGVILCFFYSCFFFYIYISFFVLFCLYLSCLGEFCTAFLLFAFCFLLWSSRNRLREYIMAELHFFFLAISQNHKALFCHKSPPRTHRDWLRRLWGRTYRNTSLMLRIVRRVLVLQRVFKTCVQAAGDLQWQEAYELMSTYRRRYGWVVLTSSS